MTHKMTQSMTHLTREDNRNTNNGETDKKDKKIDPFKLETIIVLL